jgi:hypothetical protein
LAKEKNSQERRLVEYTRQKKSEAKEAKKLREL